MQKGIESSERMKEILFWYGFGVPMPSIPNAFGNIKGKNLGKGVKVEGEEEEKKRKKRSFLNQKRLVHKKINHPRKMI